jgi:hypothetical protein
MSPKAGLAVCVDKDVLEQDVFLFAMTNYLPLASVSATSYKKRSSDRSFVGVSLVFPTAHNLCLLRNEISASL